MMIDTVKSKEYCFILQNISFCAINGGVLEVYFVSGGSIAVDSVTNPDNYNALVSQFFTSSQF